MGRGAPRASAFFILLGDKTGITGLTTFLPSSFTAIVSYWALSGVASLAVVLLILVLRRSSELVDDTCVKLLFRWAMSFAAVSIFAFPVFTQDMWLSAAWGRMIISKLNPYYVPFTPQAAFGLPLDHFPMTMSYGPLWAVISAIVMAIAGNSVVAAGVLFKGILAGAWFGCLTLIRQLTASRHVLEQGLAMVLFGWMPVSVQQTVSEGHNDVAMIFLALLWLYLLEKNN